MLSANTAGARTSLLTVAARILSAILPKAAVITAAFVGSVLAGFTFAGEWCQNKANGDPLFCAVDDGNIAEIKSLIEKGADVNRTSKDGFAPIQVAARSGKVEAITMLIDAGARVNWQDKTGGMSPLHIATHYGHVPAMSALIKSGAHVNATDNRNGTPLTYAIRGGNLSGVNTLIQASVNVNQITSGRTPIFHAVLSGRAEFITALAKAGADVNWEDVKGGFTPLHFAAYINATDVAVALIINGADINIRDSVGRTALDIATLKRGKNDAMAIFLRKAQELYNNKSE